MTASGGGRDAGRRPAGPAAGAGRQVDLPPGHPAGRPGRGPIPPARACPTASTSATPWPRSPPAGRRSPRMTTGVGDHRRRRGRSARAGRGHRRRQLGHRHPAAGRVGGRPALADRPGRRRVDRPPAHGPGGRAAAGHGRLGRRPRRGPAAAAGRSGAAGCGASTTTCRSPAPRSRAPSCWPAWPPRARPPSGSRSPVRAHTEELLALCGADIDGRRRGR